MNKPTLPIVLSGLEVIHLSDSIAADDHAKGLPERDAYVPLARQALLLLGSAYRELVAPVGISDGLVSIHITEELAWLFRSKVRTGDLAIDGKTNIGIGLLLKLYEILSSFKSGLEITPVAAEEPAVTEDVRKFFTLLKEGSDARGTTDHDPNPDADAVC